MTVANVDNYTYKRNEALYLTTRDEVVSPNVIGGVVLGTGTVYARNGAGVLAGPTDYSFYASAYTGNGGVILSPTAMTWEVPGGWTTLLPALLFSGVNGTFTVYVKVYQYGYSDPAHQIDECAFVMTDGGV